MTNEIYLNHILGTNISTNNKLNTINVGTNEFETNLSFAMSRYDFPEIDTSYLKEKGCNNAKELEILQEKYHNSRDFLNEQVKAKLRELNLEIYKNGGSDIYFLDKIDNLVNDASVEDLNEFLENSKSDLLNLAKAGKELMGKYLDFTFEIQDMLAKMENFIKKLEEAMAKHEYIEDVLLEEMDKDDETKQSEMVLESAFKEDIKETADEKKPFVYGYTDDTENKRIVSLVSYE